MPAGEIAAAVTGLRAALDITKAMVGLRDAETFRAKSIELQTVVLDAFEKAIEAREAHTLQANRISQAPKGPLSTLPRDRTRYVEVRNRSTSRSAGYRDAIRGLCQPGSLRNTLEWSSQEGGRQRLRTAESQRERRALRRAGMK